jgi:nuclear transport factor 2 (NTF2) superfamily protein
VAYTPKYDYRAKDALPSGNSAKVIRGAELMEEFEAISADSKSAELAAVKWNGSSVTFAVNVQSVTSAGSGNWRITFDQEINQVDQQYAVVATPAAINGKPLFCYVVNQQDSYVDLGFREDNGSSLTVPSTVGFTMIVLDTEA